MRLTDKVAVITGASSGIGEAAAKLFAQEGAAVALVARGKDSLEQVAEEIEKAGGSAGVFSVDVGDTEAVSRTFAQISNTLGGIDILLNCAGLFYPTPGGEMEQRAWRQMLDINVGGVVNTCNAVLPGMKTRGSGSIVNIASVAAVMALGGYSLYCASKAAVVMLSKALAVEFAPHGIQINVIAPGNTATPMNRDIRTDPAMKQFLDGIAAATPSRNTFSQPQDIARAALFLVSEGAPFHGAVLLADEGISLGM